MLYTLNCENMFKLGIADPQVLAHVRRVGRTSLCLCAPVEAELWYGVAKSTQKDRNRRRLLTLLDWLPCLAYSSPTTRKFGEIRTYLNQQGTTIGPYDLQIAAIALTHELTLVTHNTREFARVPGLSLEDWLT
jgi:tRNA(fMet)-specific endonuclease VapC